VSATEDTTGSTAGSTTGSTTGSPAASAGSLPVALVTGAGRGIGRAVAVALSQAGHRVALTSRSRDELEATAAACPGPTMVHPCDLTEGSAIDDLYAAIEAEWGPVEVLVANAGAGVSAPVAKTTDEQWQRMLDLNLTAPFRCLRRAVPSMVERGTGRVVVLASVASKVGEPYISAYTASKHGVLGLVRSAAAELARTGVTVNAVCPGYVDTPMTDATVEGIVARTGRSTEEARAILEAKQPIGRLITPEEVAEAVMACVRNGGITGQGINVDGGALQS
jgi:NAD(P)-dependent dehydrogenase (short-subunit alcohol dehydrogenase family)